jgi:heme-degrading monooxygenase HmoA
MPVPDQVRDDGSGIPLSNALEKHWIPGQARNGNTATYAVEIQTTGPAGLLFTTKPKEGIMAIKVLIKRKFKGGNMHAASRFLINHRNGAMRQPGYISSETMQSLDDPDKVLVVSMWQSIDYWQAWKNSETRMADEKEFKDYIVGQAEFEHYSLGLSMA